MMHVVAVLPAYSASSMINVVIPLRHLSEQGSITFETYLENEISPSALAQADILVTSRAVDPTYKPIFELALSLRIPIIYDLDDNLLEVPPHVSSSNYINQPAKQAHLRWMLSNVQHIRVHSTVLQQIVKPYNQNTSLVWGAVDWSLVPPILPVIRSNPIEIVYAVSSESGEMFFSLIQEDIKRLLNHYGEKIQLHCLGYYPPGLKHHPNVVFVPYESNYATFFSKFTRHGYAIGLAPMLDSSFYQSKTNLKYRDYAAAGAAGVYSDCPLYRNSVTDHEAGLLVSNTPGNWFAAVSELIENPKLLESIRSHARKTVEQRYNLRTVAEMWMDDLSSLPSPVPLTAHQLQTIKDEKWWFNRPHKPDTPMISRLRRFYHTHVPFSLHVGFSRWYHRLKRILNI